MYPTQGISHRIRAAAACAALLCAGAVLADPAAPPQAPGAGAESGMTHERMRALMEQRHAEHVTAMLDHLAGRLEIKSSQEPAWQAFSAALRELLSPPPRADAAPGTAPRDAATLAREHADHAAEHAQKLARMADATAKLEQALGAEQRAVLDEAARRFARGDGGRSWMAHGGWREHEGAACDAHHGHDGMPYGHRGRDDDDDDAPRRPLPR